MPDSGIDCGLMSTLSVTTRVADRLPLAVGLKVMLTEQTALGLNVPMQLFVSLKSLGSAPEIATLVIDREVPPALVMVIDFVELPESVLSVPKFKLVALNLASGSMTVAESVVGRQLRRVRHRQPLSQVAGRGQELHHDGDVHCRSLLHTAKGRSDDL